MIVGADPNNLIDGNEGQQIPEDQQVPQDPQEPKNDNVNLPPENPNIVPGNPNSEENNNIQVNPPTEQKNPLENKPPVKKAAMMSPEKRSRVLMYAILMIYIGALFVILIIFNIKSIHDDIGKSLTVPEGFDMPLLMLFVTLAGALALSIFCSTCDFWLANHCPGVLFTLGLAAGNSYSLIYSSVCTEQGYHLIICFLAAALGGSIGLFVLNLVKQDKSSLCLLMIVNAICAAGAGIIIVAIISEETVNFWDVFFAIVGLIISVFNVYSSQLRLRVDKDKDKNKEKDKEKDTKVILYSQPFEFNLSFFKLLYLIGLYFVKFIKLIIASCKSQPNQNAGGGNTGNQVSSPPQN